MCTKDVHPDLHLVLIGMPGCGKSAVGQRLARCLHRPFIDTDTMIEERTNMSISHIFQKKGEAFFRDLEKCCVQDAVQGTAAVIATGGGVVLFPENMSVLKERGFIVFLHRNPQHIVRSTSLCNRPLVQNDTQRLEALYTERLPLYRRYAMYTVPPLKGAQETARRIRKAFLCKSLL